MPHYLFFWAMLFLSCGYAIWRGNKYERLAGIICIAASIVSFIAHAPVHKRYLGVEDIAVGDSANPVCAEQPACHARSVPRPGTKH